MISIVLASVLGAPSLSLQPCSGAGDQRVLRFVSNSISKIARLVDNPRQAIKVPLHGLSMVDVGWQSLPHNGAFA